MKKNLTYPKSAKRLTLKQKNAKKVFIRAIFLFTIVFSPIISFGQLTPISNYVLYGGFSSSSNNFVQIGSSSSIQGGTIGSNFLVKTTGTANITGGISSGGLIILSNSNSVAGKMTAANATAVSGTILSVGTGASSSMNFPLISLNVN